MAIQETIRNKIKSIISSAKAEDEILTEKHAFMYYCFEQSEDADPIETLNINVESFENPNINIDGYYMNLDENTSNLYIVYYDRDAQDSTKMTKTKYKQILSGCTNAIEMVIDNSYRDLDRSSYTYEILEAIREKIKECEIVVTFMSNLIVPENFQESDVIMYNGISYALNIIDYSFLESKINSKDSDIYKLDFREKFDAELSAVKISSTKEFDIYMTAVSGSILAQLYSQDSVRLLESNVRSYLKKTSRVNKGIYATVKDAPEEFAAYNNGLATVATSGDIEKTTDQFYKIKSLNNWQIVNGGQTTATLHECRRDHLDLDSIIVPCKITVLTNVDDPQELISNISTYSNTQTAIKRSDPPSNLKYYIDIKRLSDTNWVSVGGKNYLCFFERTNGEFNTALRRNNYSTSFKNRYPKVNKFSKLDLAKSIVCWELKPEVANLGSEKNFEYFNNIVKDQILELTDSYYQRAYALVLLYRLIDKTVKMKKITTYKSTIVTYTIATIARLSDKKFDLDSIWVLQKLTSSQESDVNALIDLVYEKLSCVPQGTDIRMWARTGKCWEYMQEIEYSLDENEFGENVAFFVENRPKEWIEKNENLKNPALWTSLLHWNEQTNILRQKEKNMVNGMRSISTFNKPVTTAQKSYAVSIYLKAVKEGFVYSE